MRYLYKLSGNYDINQLKTYFVKCITNMTKDHQQCLSFICDGKISAI